MTSNDLAAPLGLDRKKPRFAWKLPRLPLTVIGTTAITGVLALGLSWVTLVDDPHGGEPVASVALVKMRDGVIDQRDIAVAPRVRGTQETAPGTGPAKLTEAPARGGLTAVDPSKIAGGAQEGAALPALPLPALVEDGPHGPLPKIGADGLRPMDAYARPARQAVAGMARVVVIVGGVGLSQTGTDLALRTLPPTVTLGIAPYGTSLDRWTQKARAQGFELLLQVPLEPFDYPDNDPGPHTLLAGLPAEANLDRLKWVMARTATYAGVVGHMGARFTASDTALTPILQETAKRGLMWVDDGSSARSIVADVARAKNAPFVKADVVIDAVANDEAIEARLAQLEALARQKGIAVGVATALPISIRRIGDWAKALEARGIVMVPATVAARGG